MSTKNAKENEAGEATAPGAEVTSKANGKPAAEAAAASESSAQSPEAAEASPASAPVAAAPSELEALQAKYAEERAAMRDQLLRLAADFDNFRKRARREQDETRKFGTERLLQDVLPVLDNLDRAVSHAEGEDNPLVNGVRLVVRQFNDVLSRHGVQSFASAGKPFDPEQHEAVSQAQRADVKPGTVLDEVQRGYRLNDRLLRPARVVVAIAPVEAAASGDSKTESHEEEDEEDEGGAVSQA
jgi:molecular chaperone GrpE